MNKTFTEQDMQNYADYVAKAALSNITPNLDRWYAEWHKPTKKVIDLSVLIDSQIDCEFKPNGGQWYVGKLKEILASGLYEDRLSNIWEQCQPRVNHKHAWPEGECPLPEGFEVKVWFRSGGHTVVTTRSGNYWGINGDTMCFEVLGVADGYVMPWEHDDE